MKNALEAASYTIIIHVLPMWHGLKLKLAGMSSGFIATQEYPKQLCTRLVDKIYKMEMHDLFVACCVLHPGMPSFDRIMQSETKRSTCRAQGCIFISKLLPQKQLSI